MARQEVEVYLYIYRYRNWNNQMKEKWIFPRRNKLDGIQEKKLNSSDWLFYIKKRISLTKNQMKKLEELDEYSSYEECSNSLMNNNWNRYEFFAII
jgi:hypothetical protein